MASMADFSVYTLPPSPPKWDRVGRFFIGYCATWTTVVACGMAFCLYNRNHPILKVRGLALSFTAIACLHMYWIMAQIVYPIGMTMPLVIAYDVQYFVMGTWFPAGIALFHASNLRFLHVAKLQKQFTSPDLLRFRAGCNGSKSSWLCRLRNMNYTARIMTLICIGLFFQFALTLGMWMACRKYHPTFGIPGTNIRGATIPEQLTDLGQGWEWWPTVLWQFIWSWVVAPVLLWRSWGIRDTLGWRTQTIGCCLSSLHATPLFLIASYVPAFQAINAYWPPSQWLHLSTMMFEIFTIFVPAVQLIRHNMLAKKTIAANEKYGSTSSQTQLMAAEWQGSSLSLAEKGSTLGSLDEELGERLYTMSALDHVLKENPAPLQEFSALCDFSGENIAFLTKVSTWQTEWTEIPNNAEAVLAFQGALEIYTNFISPRDSDFPLNLSSQDLKTLEQVFEAAARSLLGETSVNYATPFDTDLAGRHHSPASSSTLSSLPKYEGEVPSTFDSKVFDAAVEHIKFLVLTNTWPKFIKEMHDRRRSTETERTDFTAGSDTTLASRISVRLTQVLNRLLKRW